MSKLNIITRVVLLALLAINIVVAVLFGAGGSELVNIAGTDWDQPYFTDSLLNWSYVLLGVTILLTLALSAVKFIKSFASNPLKGVKSLLVIVVFVAVFVVSWMLGSSDTLRIIGYEGTDNTGFWAQYSDMCIFSAYILGAGTILALLGSIIYAKVK